MHRKIALAEKPAGHFAAIEREFYINCNLGEYYHKFAGERLRYDYYLRLLTSLVPSKQIVCVSQHALARNTSGIAQSLLRLGEPEFMSVAETPLTTHRSYAEEATVVVPGEISSELSVIYSNSYR